MYTKEMYISDRTWVLSKIRSLRADMRILSNEHGFDVLFPSDLSEINRRIKAHQEMLVIARARYYQN